MCSKGEKRNNSDNSFLQNWLKRKKQQSPTRVENEAFNDNDLQHKLFNESQQTTSMATSSTTSITAASLLLLESQTLAPESSTSETTHGLQTADLINLNETISITNIATELRELQSLFLPCEQLVKQTQSSDFSEEIFTIDLNLLSKSLKDMTIKIEQLCEQQTLKIEENRGVITTANRSKFVSRDPSDYKKYDDDELRYLVSCGPYRDLNLSYPQNPELKKKNKQCSFTSNWYNDFPYLEYSLKKDAVYCFCCRLFGSGSGSEKSQQA